MVRKCFVPSCKNSSDIPNKKFIYVPKLQDNRERWLEAVGRELTFTTNLFCCEDHFDLPNDMVNYMKYSLMGGNIVMKTGVVPHLMLTESKENSDPNLEHTTSPPSTMMITPSTSSSGIKRQLPSSSTSSEVSSGSSPASIVSYEQMDHFKPAHPEIIYLVDQTSDSDQIDFNQKCRCCLINTGKMASFYDLYSSETCVSELFTLMTSLEVSGDQDLLPTKICHECLCELSQSYKFVLKCRESDNKLRKYLSKETKYKNKITHTDGLGVKTKNAFTQTIELIVFANDVKLEIDEFDPLSDISLEHHTFGYKSNHSKSLNGGSVHAPNYESVNVINATENNLNEFDILKHEIKVENEHLNDSDDAPPCHKLQSVDVSQFNQLQEAIDIEDESKQDVTAGTRDSGYNCKFCQKSFKIYSLLKSHQKIPSKTKTTTIDSSEKPYACAICENCFKKKIPLIYQMRTHTGEKPYSCKLCDKSSSRTSTLHYHMRTHTDEKPYSRSSCSESFNRTERLVTYM